MAATDDHDLIQSYLDGELAAPAAAALEQRLAREPQLADMLITLSREEAIVSEWAKSQAVVAAADLQPAAALPTPARKSRPWLAAGALIAGLAALVAVTTMGGLLSPPAHSPVYAQLEDVQGEVYVVSETGGEGVIGQSGQALRQGQTIRTGEGSFAVVAFPDSGKIEVSTDTTIRLLDSPIAVADQGMQVFLEAGTVAAESKRSPQRPMVLSTPHAETRLAESRASISSAPRGTRIEQERGQVQVTRKGNSQPPMAIPAGWVALAPANASEQLAKQPMPPPLNQARLVLREGVVNPQTLAYTPDGKTLAAGCGDGVVKFWNLDANGLPLPVLRTGGKMHVRCLGYSTDGAFLAALGDERVVKLYDGSLSETGSLKGAKLPIFGIAFSPDGSLIATAGGNARNGEVKIWSAAARIDLATLAGHTAVVTAVAFSPNSQLLATASRDGTVKVWDLASRELRHTLLGHSGAVNTVAFSPDGATLATGAKDQTVKFWDVNTGMEQRTFQQGLVSEVRSLAFSPDGKMLAVADQNVQLLDAATGRQLLTLKGHKNAIACVIFSPNGRELATAGFDRTVRVWDVPTLGQ